MSTRSSAKASKADPFAFDRQFAGPVCGIDEVGRGPLAGPVVAACVSIPGECLALPFWREVTDSKALSAKRREILYEAITEHCVYGIAEISPAEIDRLNIHHATLLAMRTAYGAMAERQPAGGSRTALVDGKFVPPGLPCPAQAVVKGDSRSLSIGAASIVAKVHRDRLMSGLHALFDVYGWARNAGYGTAEHLAAIQAHGITEHHRRSFSPCAAFVSAA